MEKERGTEAGDARSILIVDDDLAVRELVADVLERDGYSACHASTGEEALELARRRPPALAVLDINLPGISGYEVCRELREGHQCPVIFLSGEKTEPLDRVAGLLLGADDYVVKPFAPDELLARVRNLVRRSRRPGTNDAVLTDRELQVLRLLAAGRRQAEIAGELTITPKTVGTHIENILRKLGVQSRAQAVALAYRTGLVTPSL